MTQQSLMPVRFVRDHQIHANDFPGAAAFQGGYLATELAGLPADVAADLAARGIAEANPTPAVAPAAPAIVKLFVQKPFTIAHCDYLPGDVGGFPQPIADQLIASGKATLA